MQGYHRRVPGDCFDADGWFHTGDLFRVDAEGYHYFLGRAGSMIKTAGANVAPAEVEAAITALLEADGHTAAVHVLGLPDAERGEIVAAVLGFDEDADDFDAEELRRRLRTVLSSYKIPRRIRVCRRTRIPLLAGGKPDTAALRRLAADS